MIDFPCSTLAHSSVVDERELVFRALWYNARRIESLFLLTIEDFEGG